MIQEELLFKIHDEFFKKKNAGREIYSLSLQEKCHEIEIMTLIQLRN